MNTPYHQTGFVVSDLHLFTARSESSNLLDQFKRAIQHADFFVLNGDIFDFKWSTFKTTEQTLLAAKHWLHELIQTNQHCQVHFVLGNHDTLDSFINTLEALADQHANFHWHKKHIQIDNRLFVHGDLHLEKNGPAPRHFETGIEPKPQHMHHLYTLAVFFKLHRLISKYFSARYCAKRIHAACARDPEVELNTIEHIYFGHTHEPFDDFEYQAIRFHNTGSAIKGLQLNALALKNTKGNRIFS